MPWKLKLKGIVILVYSLSAYPLASRARPAVPARQVVLPVDEIAPGLLPTLFSVCACAVLRM